MVSRHPSQRTDPVASVYQVIFVMAPVHQHDETTVAQPEGHSLPPPLRQLLSCLPLPLGQPAVSGLLPIAVHSCDVKEYRKADAKQPQDEFTKPLLDPEQPGPASTATLCSQLPDHPAAVDPPAAPPVAPPAAPAAAQTTAQLIPAATTPTPGAPGAVHSAVSPLQTRAALCSFSLVCHTLSSTHPSWVPEYEWWVWGALRHPLAKQLLGHAALVTSAMALPKCSDVRVEAVRAALHDAVDMVASYLNEQVDQVAMYIAPAA